MTIHAHHGLLMAGGVASSYNDLVIAASPLLWYKHEEATGTTASDSSGNGYHATSIIDFSIAGASVNAVSGYAGVGRGQNVNRSRMTTASTGPIVGTSSSGAWTLLVWMTSCPAGSFYVASRDNDHAILYGYVANKVECYSSGGDLRTGTSMTLTHATSTTPHMVVYRYNNGVIDGFMDGVSQFASVSSSVAIPSSVQRWVSGGYDGGGTFNGSIHDFQVYNRALSNAEITAFYNARNVV